MKTYEVYNFNEQAVNNVAAVGNDTVAQRMAERLKGEEVNVSEGLSIPPVKMCYPY